MTRKKAPALAREKLEGRVVGGKFSQLANYSDLFERSHDGIAFVDVRNHEVLETNAAFRGLIPLVPEPEGKPIAECFGSAEGAEIERWFGGTGTTLEVGCADGRVLEFSAAKVRLADYCEVYQLLARDVTKERERRNLLERQSLTDEMTGLANFRAFRARLGLEHERAEKQDSPYSVVFFDVDHFKHFNDRNGHPAGDETLRRLAKVLRGVSGRSEFVARYGGEEFVALLAGADLEAGRGFAERARAAIEAEDFPHGEAQPLGRVTASVGVAAYAPAATADAVLKRADEALYESKKAGRNRVTAYVPTEKAALSFLLKKAA